jgi:hypothetical protein
MRNNLQQTAFIAGQRKYFPATVQGSFRQCARNMKNGWHPKPTMAAPNQADFPHQFQ